MYACASDVMVTDLGDELVLLDPRSGEMFALNGTARFVWQQLPAASALRIACQVEAEFDVAAEHAYPDVVRLLNQLQRAGLVSIEL